MKKPYRFAEAALLALIVLVAGGGLLSAMGHVGEAHAQGTVNQGSPGTPGQGWPQIPDSCARLLPDGGSPHQVITFQSTTDGGVIQLPPYPTPSRRYVVGCLSPESRSTACLAKCRTDGVNPVMGDTNRGDVLLYGACISYGVATKGKDAGFVPILCTTNGNDGGCTMTSFECL